MRRGLALAAALVLLGCASSNAFRAGELAEKRQDWDAAILQYGRALQLEPENRVYRASLERVRLRGSEQHAAAGRRLAAQGLYRDALEEYTLAVNLNPKAASLLEDEIRDTDARLKAGAGPTSLEMVKERARERALPGLVLPPEADQPLGLSFRGASLREAYLALGRSAGVNIVFDPGYQDQTISVDLKVVAFEQALATLASVGRTFHRVLDAQVLMVVPDTPQKRREYEQQVVKTFFLSNADLKETIDLLRVVLGARRVAPLPGANALTINDTPDKVAAAERIVLALDKKRAEVVVDVEILEVNRGRLRDYGIEITSRVPGIDGIAGAAFPRSTTLDENPYKASNIVVSNLPGVIYRLLHSDSTTHLLANPQLRASEGQTAQARFGDQVPVPVTTFTPIASGGVSQQPITSFDYKNVGVNIDITPRVHHDGEVSLVLKIDISSVGPPGYQALPTFNSRQVTSVIRLKDGESNILAGLISETERTSMSGIPGLAAIPILGRVFARNRVEAAETDIVMTLTPRVVRRPALTEDDLRAFQIGGEASPLLFEIPGVTPSLPGTPPAPQPVAPRIEPIRPPSPTPTPPPGQDR
jgi:general secretion pathway protein D